jgi:hypothetical protein
MSEKRVSIDTSSHRGLLFKISEHDGKYRVFAVDPGFIANSYNRIGEARSLEDAILVAKSYAKGTIRNVRISDW